MGSRIQAVFFDLDGTLLDTLADIAEAMNTVLERHGLPVHPVDAYRRMVGSGFARLVERASPAGFGEAGAVNELVSEFRLTYDADPVRKTEPYPGVMEMVSTLHSRGIPMAVVSNKADELVQPIVRRFFAGPGFDDVFRVVQGMRPDVAPKPDPSSVLAIASLMHVAPQRVAYVGDSDIDVQTALAAGMAAVGAAWGFRGEAELRAAGAEAIVRIPGDVIPWMDGAGSSESTSARWRAHE